MRLFYIEKINLVFKFLCMYKYNSKNTRFAYIKQGNVTQSRTCKMIVTLIMDISVGYGRGIRAKKSRTDQASENQRRHNTLHIFLPYRPIPPRMKSACPLLPPNNYPCYALFLYSAHALILRRRLPPGKSSNFYPKTPNAGHDAMVRIEKSGLSTIFKGFSKEKAVELMEFDRIGAATFIRTNRRRGPARSKNVFGPA
jgi:hypothetical protein